MSKKILSREEFEENLAKFNAKKAELTKGDFKSFLSAAYVAVSHHWLSLNKLINARDYIEGTSTVDLEREGISPLTSHSVILLKDGRPMCELHAIALERPFSDNTYEYFYKIFRV